MLKYLIRIGVFRKADVRIMPSIVPEKRRGELLCEESSRALQTQPGIRAGQMRLACGIAWDVVRFSRVPIRKEEYLWKAEAEVQGQMLEDAVFADLQDVLPEGGSIFKLKWDADLGETAEFDAAVVDERDPGAPRVSLFEVKHTDDSRGNPEKYMKSPLAIAQVAEAFGRVVSRAVVDNGPTDRRAVLWVNADEFLGAVGDDPEGCLFPQLSARWSPPCAPLSPGWPRPLIRRRRQERCRKWPPARIGTMRSRKVKAARRRSLAGDRPAWMRTRAFCSCPAGREGEEGMSAREALKKTL